MITGSPLLQNRFKRQKPILGGGRMKEKISKEVLEVLYIRQKIPTSEIGKLFDRTSGSICYWLKFYGIKPRVTAEAVKLFVKKKKIKIPKEELIELYKKKKLVPSKIAKVFDCKMTTILNRLREYKIKVRPSNGNFVKIAKEELIELYIKQGLTTFEISEKYNCCQATIWKRLKRFGIKVRPPRSPNPYVPDKETLLELYVKKRLSSWELEKLHGFSRSTVHRKLRAYGIKTRSPACAQMVHSRKDFSGDLLEKAYLIGFRLGDLRVRTGGENSETISIECGTTKEEQLQLIKNMFKRYSTPWISKKNKRGAKSIGVGLPLSFSFLLSKVAPDWIFNKEEPFFSFLAGFTDAEGYIGVLKRGAVYALGNYDKELLERIRETLIKFGISCRKLYLGARKGYVMSEGYVHNGDYWSLRISKKVDLLKLLNTLSPYTWHLAKVSALNLAIEDIEARNRKFGNINMNTA